MGEQNARRLERTRKIEEMLGAGAAEAQPSKRRPVYRRKSAKVIDMAEYRITKALREQQ